MNSVATFEDPQWTNTVICLLSIFPLFLFNNVYSLDAINFLFLWMKLQGLDIVGMYIVGMYSGRE